MGAQLFASIATKYNSNDPYMDSQQFTTNWSNTTTPVFALGKYLLDVTLAEKNYKELMRSYDTCYNNWKQSGWHDDISLQDFSDYALHKEYLVYLHAFLQEHRDLTRIVRAELPENAVIVSGIDGCAKSATETKRKYKKSKSNYEDTHMAAHAAAVQANVVVNAHNMRLCEKAASKKKSVLHEMKKREDIGTTKQAKQAIIQVKKKVCCSVKLEFDNMPFSAEDEISVDTHGSLYDLANEYLDATEQYHQHNEQANSSLQNITVIEIDK